MPPLASAYCACADPNCQCGALLGVGQTCPDCKRGEHVYVPDPLDPIPDFDDDDYWEHPLAQEHDDLGRGCCN